MNATRMLTAALVALAFGLAAGDADSAQAGGPLARRFENPGPFANYYVEPNVGLASKMYPTPHPAPAWVGQTYYTYEGLYPHQWMSKHYDVYKRYNGTSRYPVNTTRILYW
jgi:hypothetical protein